MDEIKNGFKFWFVLLSPVVLISWYQGLSELVETSPALGWGVVFLTLWALYDFIKKKVAPKLVEKLEEKCK